MKERYIQEEFKSDPWKMMIACIMLNHTNIVQVRRVIYDFFDRFPTCEDVSEKDREEITKMTKSLGFFNKRTNSIIKFSKAFKEFEGDDISVLPGIGKYASDSYRIFFKNDLDVVPEDKKLIEYLKTVKK